MLPFLDQVEELQPAVGVFLGDGDDEPEVRLHHLLLRLPRLALALLHLVDDVAEFLDLQAGLRRELADVVAELGDRRPSPFRQKDFQPLARGQPRDAARPVRVELVPAVVREELGAVDAMALAEPDQLAVIGDEPLVDVVELLDQRIRCAPG